MGLKNRRNGRRRWLRWLAGPIVLLFVLPVLGGVAQVFGSSKDWRTASRESTGIAPDPAVEREAIVQVYVARAFGWRGALGVHSWIAVKPTDAAAFTVHEVVGWYAYRGQSAVRRSNRAPDGMWYGNAPEIIAELRGEGVDAVIERIEAAAAAYPYTLDYTVWPGPNSNTFIAYIARAVPELGLDLPPTAIGKDYLTNGAFFARAPSGTGWQISLRGLFGVLVALDEGIEINLLGLTVGLDFLQPALKLPGLGRVGYSANP